VSPSLESSSLCKDHDCRWATCTEVIRPATDRDNSRTLEPLRGSGPFCFCADSHSVPIDFSSKRGNLDLGCAVLCPTGQGPCSPTLRGAGLLLLFFSRPPSRPVVPRVVGGPKANSSQGRDHSEPRPSLLRLLHQRCMYQPQTGDWHHICQPYTRSW
jgi:hypothetical protein